MGHKHLGRVKPNDLLGCGDSGQRTTRPRLAKMRWRFKEQALAAWMLGVGN